MWTEFVGNFYLFGKWAIIQKISAYEFQLHLEITKIVFVARNKWQKFVFFVCDVLQFSILFVSFEGKPTFLACILFCINRLLITLLIILIAFFRKRPHWECQSLKQFTLYTHAHRYSRVYSNKHCLYKNRI